MLQIDFNKVAQLKAEQKALQERFMVARNTSNMVTELHKNFKTTNEMIEGLISLSRFLSA